MVVVVILPAVDVLVVVVTPPTVLDEVVVVGVVDDPVLVPLLLFVVLLLPVLVVLPVLDPTYPLEIVTITVEPLLKFPPRFIMPSPPLLIVVFTLTTVVELELNLNREASSQVVHCNIERTRCENLIRRAKSPIISQSFKFTCKTSNCNSCRIVVN